MSSSLNSLKDLARFFSLSGVQMRPEAAKTLIAELIKYPYHESKLRYIQKFCSIYKQWTVLKSKQGGKEELLVLDEETALKIMASQQMSSFDPTAEETRASVKGLPQAMSQADGGINFKTMKQQVREREPIQTEIEEDAAMHEEEPASLFFDKFLCELNKKVLVVGSGDLKEFPHVQINQGQLGFVQNSQRSAFNVNQTRFDHFVGRLNLVEERIFSHTHTFSRPKLSTGNDDGTTVFNLHSVVGKRNRRCWVYGILVQKEDTHYYLEDKTKTLKLSFAELEHADPEAFFTESSVVMCQGFCKESLDSFFVTRLMQPPLLANKKLRFPVHEQDYFGAYTKLQRSLQIEQSKVLTNSKVKEGEEILFEPESQSLALISNCDFDSVRQLKAFKSLLVGLEAAMPRMIVCIGRFFSEKACEMDSYEALKTHLETIGQILRDGFMTFLRDSTEWVFVPSMDDPGQLKLLPGGPLASYIVQGFKTGHSGTLDTQRIKKISLANNPCRISFLGKEIVVCRYNFMKKLKQNDLARVYPKISEVQDKSRSGEKDDSKRVASTILMQGYLLPLPQITQPVMWSFALDALNLTPEPDILVLADECKDYHHQFSSASGHTVHVLNPGNFAQDLSFCMLYPFSTDQVVQPSQVTDF